MSSGLGPQQGSDREYLHVADLPRGKWSYKILSIKGCDE